ncbi:hypothetical protein CROQUDRAFT_649848 [Cronartium quercuum f. sp. fusiforme G11]|uniref:C2H2-type domain-containing protein n=1 Tax=Cronartium quercuum f. sp. fusiforme G11 TaxID=708437 RepID=A0A9P6NUE2_9BASI|nr:hypothetical protein CROQUDRAFT_649848 [Cronartium quercuum f. sp. fusiforme G11]
MDERRSSQFDFADGPYAPYGLPTDLPSLARPVPMLDCPQSQPNFDFPFPLLPSTPFFSVPPQSLSTLVNEPSAQYHSTPPQEHQRCTYSDHQAITYADQPSYHVAPTTGPYHTSEVGLAERYRPASFGLVSAAPEPKLTPVDHSIPAMASEDFGMRVQQHIQIPEPVSQIQRSSGNQQGSTSSYYTCQICGRGFRRQSSLSQHQSQLS